MGIGYLKNHVHLLLFMAVVCICLALPQSLVAKLTVTKARISTTLTKSNRPPTKPLDKLYCLGYKTLITTDAQGRTQVFVNDDGGDFSRDEKHLVAEKEDGSPIDWDRIEIYAGGNSESVESMHVKMDGGNVNSIYMSGGSCTNSILEITGGRVSVISVQNTNAQDIKLYLSNMRYTGSSQVKLGTSADRTTVFINPDCEFYALTSRLADEDIQKSKGAFVPSLENPNAIHVYGAASVPVGAHVVCDSIVDKGMTSLKIGIGASVEIKKCNGWKSTMSKPSGVSVLDHNRITYIKQNQTCTKPELTRTYCDLCGEYDFTIQTKAAAGHQEVTDARIAATCTSPGLSAGKHCEVCGEEIVARETINAAGHTISNRATIIVDFDKETYTSGTKWISGLTAQMRKLSKCYTGQVLFMGQCDKCGLLISSQEGNHETVVLSRPSNKTEMAIWDRILESNCTRDVTLPGECKDCGLSVAVYYPKKSHQLTSCSAVASTCTEAGRQSYLKCSSCGYKFKNDGSGVRFTDMSAVEIAPKGHKYGVAASYVKSSQTKVSDRTCDSPAIYHQSCANCGIINENLIFYGEAALGHNYGIKSIDYTDPEYADEGILTIMCTNKGCGKLWPSFQYSMAGKVGAMEAEGYWFKNELVETTVLPTCVPGWGEYHLTLNFHGQRIETDLENIVPACGYIHDYDDDGVCRHQHNKMVHLPGGDIKKTFGGDIEYSINKVNGVELGYVEDDSVYSTKGYIAVPVQKNAVSEYTKKNPTTYVGTAINDPETGQPMTFTDYQVTNVENQTEFLNTVAAQTGKFYAAFYGDLVFDIADETTRLAMEKLNSVDMLGDLYIPEGKQRSVSLNDQSNITNTETFYAPNLKYVRTFAQAGVWESLYVPMNFDVRINSSVCEFADIYSFGQLFDSNGNGRIDSDDDVWLIVDMMTSGLTAGNYPYLIRAKEAGTVELEAYDGVLYAAKNTRNTCSTAGATYTFCGTHVNANLSGSNTNFMMDAQGKLSVTSNQTITPQRWYVQVAGKSNSAEYRQAMASGIRVMVVGEDISQETAIRLLQGETVEVNLDGQHYTLDGRKATNTPSGIQVVNGHKIISK